MPIRLPSRPEIVPGPSVAAPTEPPPAQSRCGICHDAPARYICPSCNAPYCSLTCFNNQQRHAGCQQGFQKRAGSELRGASAREHASVEGEEERDRERRKVLDLLRRFQGDGQPGGDGSSTSITDLLMQDSGDLDDDDDDDDDDDGSSDDEDDAKQGPTESDLPSSSAELLAMLSEEQRRVFLEAVGQERGLGFSNASRADGNERARRLWEKVMQPADSHSAADDEGDRTANRDTDAGKRLWWTDTKVAGEATPRTATLKAPLAFDQQASSLALTLGARPTPGENSKPAPGVAWNIVAVILAYTYTLLHLELPSLARLILPTSGPEEDAERRAAMETAFDTLARLAPFLFASPQGVAADANYATLVLTGPTSVTSFLLEKLGERDRSERPGRLMLELYRKVSLLLPAGRDQRITEVRTGGDDAALTEETHWHASPRIHQALGDIWAFISAVSSLDLESRETATGARRRKAASLAQRKLVFYSAQSSLLAREGIFSEDVLGRATTTSGGNNDEKDSGTGNTLPSELSRDLQSSLSLSAAPMRPHRLRRDPRTVFEEIEALESEGKGLEDEERWTTAWRVESERLGVGVGGGDAGNDKVGPRRGADSGQPRGGDAGRLSPLITPLEAVPTPTLQSQKQRPSSPLASAPSTKDPGDGQDTMTATGSAPTVVPATTSSSSAAATTTTTALPVADASTQPTAQATFGTKRDQRRARQDGARSTMLRPVQRRTGGDGGGHSTLSDVQTTTTASAEAGGEADVDADAKTA